LNYIRGRSFQQSFILIDESQNLTPHQIKTIITRAGNGSKVVCLGNLAQIDTPYLNATSSGLTYLTECFKDFPHGVHIHLQGVPRSILAEYAETHLYPDTLSPLAGEGAGFPIPHEFPVSPPLGAIPGSVRHNRRNESKEPLSC